MGREGVSELGERELGKENVCNWKREREELGERECVLVKKGVEEIE